MKIIFVFAVGLCFAVAQSLKCYKCTFGLGSLCITSETTCNSGEQCFSGVGKAVKVLDIRTKGCLKVADCNKTQEEWTIPGTTNGTVYQMVKTCCNSDLCNVAPGLPGLSGLSLALAAISALFASNLLM